MLFSPESAFRMFLAQFGNEAGRAQLEVILSNLTLSDTENEQLAKIIDIAHRHFNRETA